MPATKIQVQNASAIDINPATEDGTLASILTAINAQSTSPADAVASGVAVCVTAGVRVQFAANACKRVVVQAFEDNTGAVTIGGVTVVAGNDDTQRGMRLYQSFSWIWDISNTNILYIDAENNGDGVTFTFDI